MVGGREAPSTWTRDSRCEGRTFRRATHTAGQLLVRGRSSAGRALSLPITSSVFRAEGGGLSTVTREVAGSSPAGSMHEHDGKARSSVVERFPRRPSSVFRAEGAGLPNDNRVVAGAAASPRWAPPGFSVPDSSTDAAYGSKRPGYRYPHPGTCDPGAGRTPHPRAASAVGSTSSSRIYPRCRGRWQSVPRRSSPAWRAAGRGLPGKASWRSGSNPPSPRPRHTFFPSPGKEASRR